MSNSLCLSPFFHGLTRDSIELCHDCRNIRLKKALTQIQKADKRLLRKHNMKLSFPAWANNVLSRVRMRSEFDDTQALYTHWEREVVVASLGSRLRGPQLDNCACCALLRNHRLDSGETYESDKLVAIRYFEGLRSGQKWDCGGTPSDLVILAVRQEEITGWYAPASTIGLERTQASREWLKCQLSDCASEMPQGVRVAQPTINADEISQAINDCHQNHQECREKSTKAPPQPVEINLIDCRNRTIVETLSSETYVALSYVWGGVPATSLGSKPLPRTLEDAIEVTLSLGFQYVWIDQFCVNQHDHIIKQKQIQTMGRVYEDAVVTLVAASGSDANHGLPGAPNHPRKTHPQIEFDGLVMSQTAAPIRTEVERCAWATRGWTLQEQFFSKRFLIFAPEEDSFECRRVQFSTYWGTLYRDGHNLRTPVKQPLADWSGFSSTLHNKNEWSGGEEMMMKYGYFVGEYWPRHLSVEEDGINAFTAIMESLKIHWNEQLSGESTQDGTVGCRMTFTAGIPHLIRNHAESSEPSLNLFVQGMSWHSSLSMPMNRRKSFPSWCWAGWAPSGSNAFLSAYSMNCKSLVHNVFFLHDAAAAGSITPERLPIADHKLLSVPSAIMFDAPYVLPASISWDEDEYGSEPRLKVWGYGLVLLDGVNILNHGMFLDDIAHGKYCFIAMAEGFKPHMLYVFLMVHRVDQCRFERVSLAKVFFRRFEFEENLAREQLAQEQLGDSRTWELI